MARTHLSSIVGLAITMAPVSVAYAAASGFRSAVLNSAPLLYYPLNETSGNAHNLGSLGASYDAAYLGTPQRGVPTRSGDTGVAFDGSDDYLESLSVAPAGLTGNPTFTAEAVVFVPTGGSATLWAPFLHWGTGGTGHEVYFSFSNGNADRYYAGFYNGGLRMSQPTTLGSWHHVVWVRSGGETDQAGSILYVDGVPVTTEPDPGLCCNGTTPSVTASAFRIDRASDLTRFFTGTLDEVALYDRALTPTEVATHYSALLAPTVSALPVAPFTVLGLGLAGLGWTLLRVHRRTSAASSG